MEQDKLFSRETRLLILFGLVLNFLGARLALALELPIFLDSIGTVFVGALCGLLPGITVGFFSNAINSIGDPITLYYGLISVFIGVVAVLFSRKGFFTRYKTALLTSLVFALIGGGLGSLLTWMLSGLDMGAGISAGFAGYLLNTVGLGRFMSQLTADVVIDLADKILTLNVVYLLLRIAPEKILSRVPYGEIYQRAKDLRRPDSTKEAPSDGA